MARTRDSVEEEKQEHEAHVPDSFSVSDGGFSCGDVEAETKQTEDEQEADVPDSFSVSGVGFTFGDVEAEEKQTETLEPVESEEKQNEESGPVESEEHQTVFRKATVQDESDEQADS